MKVFNMGTDIVMFNFTQPMCTQNKPSYLGNVGLNKNLSGSLAHTICVLEYHL